MPKLTDTQLVILSAAASRNDGAALPLPGSLKIKGAVLTKTLDGLRKKGLLDEKPAARADAAWREDENGRRMTLVISSAGLQALDGAPVGKAHAQPPTNQAKAPPARRSSAGGRSAGEASAPAVRTGTKQALLIGLLKRKHGATVAEIVEATGWQAHSVRGAISGTLKKKLGLAVSSEKVEGRGRVYRIAGRG